LARGGGRLGGALAVVGLGLLLAALPVEIAAAAVVVAGLTVLAFLEPLTALAALVAMVPVSTLVSFEAGDFSVTPIEPLMVLLVVAWVARAMSRHDLRLVSGPFGPSLGLLLLAVLASSLAAQR